MTDKIFFDLVVKMNAIIEITGHDPEAVAKHLNARISPAYGTINGMLTKHGHRYYIALNESQPVYQFIFAFWHELFHLLAGHLEIAGFTTCNGIHLDIDTFSNGYMTRRLVAYTERIANLGAADRILDTGEILLSIGYTVLQEYRSSKKEYWNLLQRYQHIQNALRHSSSTVLKCQIQEAHKDLKRSYEKMMDLESSFSHDDFMTIPQIAQANQVPVHYVGYKLEALRLQGFDIDPQELLSYDKVFTKKRAAGNEYW